ncbi:unnamed protein product [Mucor hiemalis]
MENPNIHNIPYARSRDQKRWKGHAKKVSSRAETTERMRKWRAENRDKNKRNDLRCRVYRLARQKFGEEESDEKQQFINDEITRRLGRRMLLEEQQQKEEKEETLNELPFYCAPLHKIELPSIHINNITEPLPPEDRRSSSHSVHSHHTNTTSNNNSPPIIDMLHTNNNNNNNSLPPMQSFLTSLPPH